MAHGGVLRSTGGGCGEELEVGASGDSRRFSRGFLRGFARGNGRGQKAGFGERCAGNNLPFLNWRMEGKADCREGRYTLRCETTSEEELLPCAATSVAGFVQQLA